MSCFVLEVQLHDDLLSAAGCLKCVYEYRFKTSRQLCTSSLSASLETFTLDIEMLAQETIVCVRSKQIFQCPADILLYNIRSFSLELLS